MHRLSVDDETRRRVMRTLTVGCVFVVSGVAGSCGTMKVRAESTASDSAHHVVQLHTMPLPARQAAKAARVCREAESSEDANAILSWANQGAKSATPTVMAALRTASRHVAAEAKELRGMTGGRDGPRALADAVSAESTTLNETSKPADLIRSETQLLSVLHSRIALARRLRVPACAGVSPISALRATPPSLG